jgi:phage terminase large subunit
LGGFAIDEANEITKNEFLLLQGRLRLDTVPRHRGILATNPPNTDHWIFDLFSGPNADKSKYRLISASSRQNRYLPEDFVKNLEKEYPPAWVKKFVDGEFGFLTMGDLV